MTQGEFWDRHGRPYFAGPDYDPALDDQRLGRQVGRVWLAIRDGEWRTLTRIRDRIETDTGARDPEASISAQLRHLRKPRFGGYKIERRRTQRNEALWEYRMTLKEET